MMEKAAEALLSQGGIWAALFIFSVAIGSAVSIFLQGRLTVAQGDLVKCMAERVTDAKAMGDTIHANGVVMSQQISENASRTRANEAMGRAQELSAAHVANLTTQVGNLTTQVAALTQDVKSLAGENRALREQLLVSGKAGT
jgi:hypothetical protein